jgi:hypothetical protein
MNTPVPECPACRLRMEEGFVLAPAKSGRRERLSWIEGAPERSALGGWKTRGRRQLAITPFRCPRCGWLIWFAPESES